MLKILVTVVSMLFALVAAGQLTVDVMPQRAVVDPQTNTASAVVHLRNDASEPLDVLLMADDFVADGTGEGLGAKTLFAVGDATPVKSELPITIPAKEWQIVRMNVTNVGHAGIARSRLMNRATKIADLAVLRAQFPFNVAPLGWKDGVPFAIRFESGDGPYLFLRNEDPFDYFVTWSLNVPGLKLKEGQRPVLVPAQSTEMVQIPVDGWLPSKGDVNALVKNISSAGSLRLAATNAAAVGKPWKTRVIPVTIERSYWSPAQQTFRTFLLLALLVGLGGIASIIVTHGVPNRLRRINVREFIKSITPKIRAISVAVQSDLRTGIRVERTRLLQRLRSRSTISPDFAALAKECEATAHLLDREINILDRVDSNMRRIEAKWPTAGVHGPTLLQNACILLSDAQLALDRPEISDDVVNAAGALVQKAEATIDNASTLDAPSMTSVKNRLLRLENSAQFTTCEVAKKIIASVPGLHAALLMKAAEITDVNFAEFDAGSAKLDFVRRFAELCEKAEGGPEKDKCIEQFIAALRRGGFHDFRTAEGLTSQMREGVFTQHVAEEIRSHRYTINVEPQAPRVNQAVSFTIVFDDPTVNAAAARHAIGCTWAFYHAPAPEDALWIVRAARWTRDVMRKLLRLGPDKTTWQTWNERGLSVSHYFPTSGTFAVEAHFKDANGDDIKSNMAMTQTIVVSGERLGWFGERTKIEYSRLAIVLAITVAGLLVGARDELAKLDLIPGLIAVFMLGFTADQIKNILAPPPSP